MESFPQAQDDSLECTRWPEDISSRGCIYAQHVYASLAVFVDQPWMFQYFKYHLLAVPWRMSSGISPLGT